MSGKTISIVVVVLVIAAGAWYFLMSPSSGGPAGSGTPSATATAGGVSVSYTNQGFSPASVSIAQGESVTWVNNSSENLWVASDPHPAHTGYDGTSRSEHCATGYTGAAPFDSCTMLAPGASWSFVFNQAGSWGYHNHADEGMQGAVVVTPSTSSGQAASTSASVNINVQ